jgi:hypothetical protein
MIRIHDILMWIRTNILDPDPAIFFIDLQYVTKIKRYIIIYT